ncbi:hypothetical protein A2U01_0035571, partial [Trifolium medium]|nr:hypothetical protein [Trifolium medium]
EKAAKSSDLGSRGKCFLIVNSFNLSVSLRNKKEEVQGSMCCFVPMLLIMHSLHPAKVDHGQLDHRIVSLCHIGGFLSRRDCCTWGMTDVGGSEVWEVGGVGSTIGEAAEDVSVVRCEGEFGSCAEGIPVCCD